MVIKDDNDIFIFKDKYFYLNLLDRKKIAYIKNKNFCKIKGQIYHYKFRHLRFVINEILGELISEYFELDTVKSIIARTNKFFVEYLVLTELFDMDGYNCVKLDINTFPNIDINNDVGLDNLDKLEYINYKNKLMKYDVEILKLSLKKMIIRDFITNQTDRHNKNFLFKINREKVELLPLFDYEHSFFNDDYERFFNLFNFDLNLNKVREYVRCDEEFQLLLNKALEFNIYKVFERVEDEYPVILDDDEKEKYKYIVNEKQSEIKKHKLLRL